MPPIRLPSIHPFALVILAALWLSACEARADGARLDVNTATAAELAAGLKGVGAVKAGRIVAHRDAHGPFASADALLAVSGIGPKTLERLRASITVGSALEARAMASEATTRTAIARVLRDARKEAGARPASRAGPPDP